MASSDIGQLVELDQNNNGSSSTGIKKMGKNYEKYSLRPRSIQKRIETEKRAKEPKKVPKPKLRAPPLSKYRRKTANARERSRMQEINSAFDSLQQIVPQYPVLPVNAQGKTCEKLTKITTLRLAMDYISKLNKLLSSDNTSTVVIGDDDHPSYSDSVSPGSSEFSPVSTSSLYTLSPTPLQVTPPECLQTVMRSVVVPAQQLKRAGNHILPSYSQSCFPCPNFVTPVKRHESIVQSMSDFLTKSSGSGCRTGSLSSLTESDLSEYTSDLLSDEGSSLDDPMFDDIIGMDSGVCDTMDDLDHLILGGDGDRLQFTSVMSESFSHSVV